MFSLLQQENCQHFREPGQGLDLFLRPIAVFHALIEADIAAECTAIPNRTVQQGFDALRCHDVIDVLRQFAHIRTVENPPFIKHIHISRNILFIADTLQVLDFRRNSIIAPFKGIEAVPVVIAVFKDVNTADIHLPSNQFQNIIDRLLHILRCVQPLESISNQIIFCQSRFLIGIDVVINSAGQLFSQILTFRRFIIENEVILTFCLCPVERPICLVEQFIISVSVLR